MRRLRLALNRLLFPGTAVIALLVPAAAILLTAAFLSGQQKSPAAYLSYTLSAYAMTVVCARIPRLFRRGRAAVHRNQYAHRYLTDLPFRIHVSLYRALGINLFYAGIKLCSGIWYRSLWFGALAVYYGLLAVMRFLLLRAVSPRTLGRDTAAELRRCRLCGAILLVINQALTVIVVLMVRQNRGYEYPGMLIYAMAAYTFYTVTIAVIHMVKYRRYASPVLTAEKTINLAAALVSLLSLETAMLTRFGKGDSPAFRQQMTGATGAAVCTLVLAMAVWLIVQSTRKLKRLEAERPENPNPAS